VGVLIFGMETYMMQWLKTAAEKKKVREDLSTGFCPICGCKYSTGMNKAVLDHDHSSGRVRSVLCSKCNLMLGRLELYFKKLLGKTSCNLPDVLVEFSKYLNNGFQPYLHYGVIESEKKRITRWRKETIYKKLIEKCIDLEPENAYTKAQLINIYLELFKKELESSEER
jgi:hypothetical protein